MPLPCSKFTLPSPLSLIYLLTILSTYQTTAFLLPGIAVNDFSPNDFISVRATRLTSSTSSIPYSYFSVPFCQPSEIFQAQPISIAQILVGESVYPTAYDFAFNRNDHCKLLCVINFAALPPRAMKRLVHRIDEGYVAHLHVDDLPVITRFISDNNLSSLHLGHVIGFKRNNTYYLNNHLSFKILIHHPSLSSGEAIDQLTSASDTSRIVGFEVTAHSFKHFVNNDGTLNSTVCDSPNPPPLHIHENARVAFTYDVTYVPTTIAWSTRWDTIVNSNPKMKKVKTYAIINSVILSLFLTAVVAIILLRTLVRDFNRYSIDTESTSHTGWRSIHTDVFRPPAMAPFLAVCVGTGAQVFAMVAFSMFLVLIGFISPSTRGGLLSIFLSFWLLTSFVSGFVSSRIYTSIPTNVPRSLVTAATAIFLPGLAFAIFIGLNVIMYAVESPGRVPFHSLILLAFLWLFVSIPLVFVGDRMARRRKPINFPSPTSKHLRPIPPPRGGVSPIFYSIIAGILPFSTVFMELVYILHAIRGSNVYYIYSALVAVFSLLIITCAEMSIVSTYITLSAEDWASHWHTSFWGGASGGAYVFLYCLYFAFTQQTTSRIPVVGLLVFMSWSLVLSGAFSLMCGAVGFLSSFVFTRKIYDLVHID